MPRVVRFHQFGGAEVLRFEDLPKTPPAPDEVAIEVRAIGINRAELLMRQGTYIERPALPSGLGLEAAGVISAIGHLVKDLAVGDAVSIIPPISMSRWPAYGELVTYPAKFAVRQPDGLGHVKAAAAWMQYLTAFGALVDMAKLASGESLLINAASSSVGLAAIQIAKRLGARPVAMTRSPAKVERLLAAGAEHVVLSSSKNLAPRLVEASGSSGFRVVFDPVAGPDVAIIAEAMAPGGIFIEYGGLSSEDTPFPVAIALAKRLTFRGYLVHELVADDVKLENAKAFVLNGLKDGSLDPIIARTFDFGDIPAAHRYLSQNEHFGKVVVTTNHA